MRCRHTSARNEDRDYQAVYGNDTGHDYRNERLYVMFGGYLSIDVMRDTMVYLLA